MVDFSKIEKKIGYVFKNKKLLQTAITHTSYANEHKTDSFERLEFLGDSILGFVVAKNLYHIFPEKDEGQLSKIRASLVCEDSLSTIARNLDIPSYILLGVGEEKSGGRRKNSIISDVVEAILAAIFLDSGIDEAKAFVDRIIPQKSYKNDKNKDYKSYLQETFKHSTISYSTRAEKKDGSEIFFSQVYIDGKVSGEGNGLSKKSAEQIAAETALLNNQR